MKQVSLSGDREWMKDADEIKKSMSSREKTRRIQSVYKERLDNETEREKQSIAKGG